jgi:hypothetical protein
MSNAASTDAVVCARMQSPIDLLLCVYASAVTQLCSDTPPQPVCTGSYLCILYCMLLYTQNQLYHHYAELEAIHGNIEALCKLHARAQARFPRDSSQPGAGRVLKRINSIESYFEFIVSSEQASELDMLEAVSTEHKQEL